MSIKIKERFSLDEIARGLESIRTKAEGGGVGFGGFKFQELQAVLLTAIEWNDALSEFERESIINKIPFEAAKNGTVTKDSLLKAIEAEVKKRLAVRDVDYVVVFTLSLIHHSSLKKIPVGDVQFSFHADLPKGFDREGVHRREVAQEATSLAEGYTVVCAKVKAKSVYSAYSRALVALSVLRGIWNYIVNKRTMRTFRIPSGRASKPEALNKIRLGPMHTVHFPNGSLATQEWWHDAAAKPVGPVNLVNDWPHIQRNTSWCLRRYHRTNYKDDATMMWVRYAYAFDHADNDATFLKLWSLFEFLTGTAREKYDETIRRALFLCREREFHRLILEHLRERRNALVHQDDASSEVEHHIFQLKDYVEELLRLHLVLGDQFKDVREFGEFLSLPADVLALRERRQLYGKALRFREKTLNA